MKSLLRPLPLQWRKAVVRHRREVGQHLVALKHSLRSHLLMQVCKRPPIQRRTHAVAAAALL